MVEGGSKREMRKGGEGNYSRRSRNRGKYVKKKEYEGWTCLYDENLQIRDK